MLTLIKMNRTVRMTWCQFRRRLLPKKKLSDIEDLTVQEDTIYELPEDEVLSTEVSKMDAAVDEARLANKEISRKLAALSNSDRFEELHSKAEKLFQWNNPARTRIGIVGHSAAGLFALDLLPNSMLLTRSREE